MKNLMLLALTLCLALPAFAEDTPTTTPRKPNNVDQVNPPANTSDPKSLLVSGEVSIYTDDIFRGISMSNHEPVVQGWLGVSYMQFLNAGVYTTSTYFPVPTSTTGEIAKRYNVYFASAYLPVYGDLIAGVQYYRYDFIEYSSMNQDEFFLELMYKNFKLSVMHNPNYIQLDTQYQYISAEYKIQLTDKDSITPLVSTTVVEKPENVDIRNYQELRLTYTRDLDVVRVNTILSTTNREKYFTDEKYHDTAIAFGVVLPF